MSSVRRLRFAVVLVVSVILAATACSSSSSGGSGGGTLQVWVRGAGDAQKAYQALLDAFTKKTGVKTQLFMTLTDFETKVNAAASAHKLPDVVVDDAAQTGAFRSEGIVQEVDRASITGGDQIADATWNVAKDLSGKYYAVPFSVQANLLFVRNDWLQKLHLSAPTTWDDLATAAKAFTKQDPNGNGKADTFGLDVPGSTSRGYISWYWSTFLWQAGGDYFKPAGEGKYTSTINSPEAVAAATYFEKFFCTDHSVQPSAVNDVTADTNKVFQSGTAGLYFTGPYAFATADATAVKGHYSVVAPPSGPKSAQTLAEATNIFLMAGSKRTDEAKQLAEYMITPEAQQIGMTAVASSTIVRLPVNTTVNAATAHKGDQRWTLAQQLYTTQGHFEADYMPNWTAFRQATSDALNKMVASCGDPKSTLDSLNGTFQNLLKQQGVAG
ncbi:MAG TPA: sugar ABC transporter substrate-binding protein [Jatrophihabitantaceae bacterium]|nr:sugar ABC transporter substrate-binding protein [Jatrophihabitantaceae bacterium]